MLPPLHGVLKLGFHGGAQRIVEEMPRKERKSFSGYSLQDEHLCNQWQAKITTIFGICFLPFAGHGMQAHLRVSIQQRAAASLLQYASAMTEKNATSHQLRGSVSHCWPNPAQRQEEYFKKGCRNRMHQSKERKKTNKGAAAAQIRKVRKTSRFNFPS